MIFSNKYVIRERIVQSPGNVLLKIKANLKPLPGQFFEISVPGAGTTPVSAGSYNTRLLELNIRVKGCVRKKISEMSAGDKLIIKGPFGKGYPMFDLKGKNLLLLSDGQGVSVMKSVVDFINQRRISFGEVHIMVSFGSRKEVLLKDEIETWSNHYHTSIFFGKHIAYHLPSSNDFCVLICGSEEFMEESTSFLEERGFDDKNIWADWECLMKCTNGKCGQCMISGKYVCMDGPVFRQDELKKE